MKRVMVTGATGFIGRQAVAQLAAAGAEVHAIAYQRAVDDVSGLQWHRADLLDPNAVQELMRSIKPTHLLHFAWYAVPGSYPTSPENLRWSQATLELIRAFADHQGERAVLAGSCFEYDFKYGFCNEETTPRNPSTFYGTCKKSTMEVATAFAQQVGLSLAWGRIFFLYGPGEDHRRVAPSVIRALLRGEVARCSHGRQLRDFMHVADVAASFIAALESEVQGPVNIASGEPTSIRQLVETIARLLKSPDRIEFGALASPPDEPPLLLADVRKLTQATGWKPALGLEEGLARTIEWWRSAETR